MKKNIVIIGAGLVGSLLGIYLARRGHRVSLYERRADMRKGRAEEGRSINLALSDRGILALQKVGLDREIQEIAIPMPGRLIHHLDGSTVFQPYGKEGQCINSVSRAELNRKLMDCAEESGINIFFNQRCSTIHWNSNEVQFENAEGDVTSVSADIIFGADGAYSAARLQHMLHHERFDYSQYYIDCGYKELTIPSGPGNSFLMERHALHIWPRKDYMLIALPNLDGSFTCTLFFPFSGPVSFQEINTPEKVMNLFVENFPDAAALFPDLADQFLLHPTSSLVTVKCFPWVRGDRFALIGDAAHAIVPFFGQGMNCGFEDCRILDELIEAHREDWTKILDEFQGSRKPDADAIAELAIDNFTEMREKTADPKFLLQKKIESRLHEKYPERWIPVYSLVTFSPQTRYSEALRRGRLQEEIMQSVMRLPGIGESWDSPEIEQLILSRIQSA
ncbi:MAG TPA: NAD(P)/FAD-dependent oxidoreductase [Chitinophagaceae bacterium]|nr:NAD(P)/FAD-dependent oxidoreductase [Chitinophagaceae bacterium]